MQKKKNGHQTLMCFALSQHNDREVRPCCDNVCNYLLWYEHFQNQKKELIFCFPPLPSYLFLDYWINFFLTSNTEQSKRKEKLKKNEIYQLQTQRETSIPYFSLYFFLIDTCFYFSKSCWKKIHIWLKQGDS